MQCALFIDTMIYLHYRPLRELPLTRVADGDIFRIVVPRITLRELDKHKSTHLSRKIRDRAKAILDAIERSLTKNEPLDGAISLEHCQINPSATIQHYQLNAEWADDVLVATAKAYQDMHPSVRVVVLTQDTGPRLTCIPLGVRADQLDDEWRLPEELDSSERENRELRLEIARLKAHKPVLSATFPGGEVYNRCEMKDVPPFDQTALESELETLRRTHPHHSKPVGSMADFRLLSLVPDREIARYNRELNHFFAAYSTFYKETHHICSRYARSVEATICITNSGQLPADDVDVTICFPVGLVVMLEENSPRFPKAPKAPTPPQTDLEMMMSNADTDVRRLLQESSALRLPPLIKIKNEDSGRVLVTAHFGRIKHGTEVTVPKLYVEFPPDIEMKSFHCDVEVRAANVPDLVTAQLHFILENNAADSA